MGASRGPSAAYATRRTAGSDPTSRRDRAPGQRWLSQSSRRVGPSRASGPGVSVASSRTWPKYGTVSSATIVARVAGRGQDPADQLVEPDGLGTADLDHGVRRWSLGHIRDDDGQVVDGDRLQRGRRDADRAVGRGRVGDLPEELEELRRPDDRVRHAAGLDGALLRDLGPKVAAVRRAVGADDREHDVMPDPDLALRLEQGPGRRLEELEHGRGLERRRVGHVDDDIGAGQAVDHPGARDRVEAGARGGGHASWPRPCSSATTCEPRRPVPPTTTIFTACLPAYGSTASPSYSPADRHASRIFIRPAGLQHRAGVDPGPDREQDPDRR